MTFVKQTLFCLVVGAYVLCPVSMVQAQTMKLGNSAALLAPRSGDPRPPSAPFRSEALLQTPAQTNQWYSSLLFSKTPEAIYAQPFAVKPMAGGMEFSYPVKQVVPTERRDVEIQFPHANAVTVSPEQFKPTSYKLAKASDWTIDIDVASDADVMRATVGHGSPYVYFRVSRGDLRLSFPADSTEQAPGADPRVLRVTSAGQTFVFFGPTGVQWEKASARAWIARLPASRGYLSASVLPDNKPSSEALLARHAYAFVTDTKASWTYDKAKSTVDTRFALQTQQMEGESTGPLIGLYPHHWHQNDALPGVSEPFYDTVRGKIRLFAGSGFNLKAPYNGFVPYWPAVSQSAPRLSVLNDVMKIDVRNARRMMLELGNGPYWQGKGLQRITKLLDVVEQQGDTAARDRLLGLLKARIEEWFSGESRKTYFHLDASLGTLLAYPEEYFSVRQMNDHHFHYGYWIRTLAEIALRDRDWASAKQWGGMVDLMIADIATADRSGKFPFLRTFDVYEGHSWASGIGLGSHGNNQESSSEAINAWAALILWGEITGNDTLRDLGVYLYSSEIQAIRTYWFDVHGIVFAPEYKHQEVSMLFGGKYAHNTWWTDEPRQIKGINLLPITTSSVYLARDPAFIKKSLATLPKDTEIYNARGKRADPVDMWQDIFAKYLAMADASAGLAAWDRWGAVEFGDTRSHTLHTLMSLEEMGQPDLNVTADTALYSVFSRTDGTRTYLAFNAKATPLTVRFSTGKVMQVAPGTLAREN
jgi:endoglucanase Acf2